MLKLTKKTTTIILEDDECSLLRRELEKFFIKIDATTNIGMFSSIEMEKAFPVAAKLYSTLKN